jgi:hypothetical protein
MPSSSSSSRSSRGALLAALALCCASAHICLVAPPQRGALNVSTPGDPSCYRRTDYCGGVPPGAPRVTYVAGETVTITLAQNLNHFYPARPGFLDVAIASTPSPTAADFVTLAAWTDAPAFDMVDQTMFSVAVTLPAGASAHSVLRARYVSNNPLEVDPPSNTDAVFWTCADIAIVPAAAAPRVAALPPNPAVAPTPGSAGGAPSCSTPASWTANFTESNAWGFVQHTVWWDAARQRTRWDKAGSLDASGPSEVSLVNDYASAKGPVEWVNFVSRGQCLTYGPDAYFPWAYGPALSMAHAGRSADGVDTWEMAGAPAAAPYFRWVTRDLGGGLCEPLAWVRGQASAVLTGFRAGPIDPAVLVPDAACTRAPAFAGCRADALRAAFARQE